MSSLIAITPWPEHVGLTLAEGMFLVSWWKPILLLLPFIGWGWVVSNILDKHAARFHLAREGWNIGHMVVAILAFGGALAVPMEGPGAVWIGFGILVVVLSADVVVFALMSNKDERVPEEHHLKFDMSMFAQRREDRASAKLAGKVLLVIKGANKETIVAPEAGSPEFDLRVIAESIYIDARTARASKIDIIPAKDGVYAVTQLVDGVRQTARSLPAAEAVQVMDFWKAAAGLDIADRRRRQTGTIVVSKDDDEIKARLTSIGTKSGMRLSMLFDPAAAVKRATADLGLLDSQTEQLKEIITDGTGIVLLAGLPDGGRTTTMYAMVKMHDAYTTNVQTIETDPASGIEGVRQNVFDAQAEGPEYSTLVRSILRRDPYVLAIAECPDAATALEVAKVDQSRTRVYLTLPADSSLNAVQLWCKNIGDLPLAAECLRGVVVQKLLRKLCTNCRVGYQPAPDMLKKLGLPADKVKQLFKKGGQVLIKNKPEVCPLCQGTGYYGQEGVFEVYPIDDAEREMIKAGNLAGLRAEFRKRQIPNLQQAALRKTISGVTSVEEVLRITADKKKVSPTKKQNPAPQSPASV